MRETDTEPSRPAPYWRNWAELFEVIKLLRGPIVVSIAASAILFAPDQIREIYRIDAADRNWRDIGTGMVALAVMCTCFWWVSFRITHSLGRRQHPETRPGRILMATLPGVIAALPLFAAGFGLLASLTESNLQPDPTSPWAGKAEEISAQMAIGLKTGAGVFFVVAAMVLIATHIDRLVSVAVGFERRVQDSPRSFFSIYGFLVSLAIVIGATAAVIASPVTLPTVIGTLPLVALFFIALALMAGHLTFWHEWTRLPFFALLGIAALGFSALDLNDNHEIAAVTDPTKVASDADRNAILGDSWDSFAAWYKARPNRDQFKTTYPVYIVAAQGGGIYAAYHAAVLLARLQDLCPEFRNHLFAISSVSGGSLGAAVFASTVKALAAKPNAPASPDPFDEHLPCPSMEPSEVGDTPDVQGGPHEEAVNKILRLRLPLTVGGRHPVSRFHAAFPVVSYSHIRPRPLARAGLRGQLDSRGACRAKSIRRKRAQGMVADRARTGAADQYDRVRFRAQGCCRSVQHRRPKAGPQLSAAGHVDGQAAAALPRPRNIAQHCCRPQRALPVADASRLADDGLLRCLVWRADQDTPRRWRVF